MVGASAPRPVRIPRPGTGSTRAVRLPATALHPVPSPHGAALDRRENRGGTRRVVRLTVLFVVGIAVLFGALAVYAAATPGGKSPGSEQAVELFAALGVAIATGGAVLTLASAPRAVEFGSRQTVVVGRFGRRRRFPAREELSVRLVRRYPTGFLSDSEVDAVEVLGGTQKATFFLERGILEPTSDRPDRSG